MTTTTPNMNLVLPDVSVTAGPQWATLLNAAYSLIDSHDHSSGKGVQITPAGLNISSDLTFGNNNATNFRTTRFTNNGSFTIGSSDRTALYALNNELYYVDGAGNNVQLTLNGAVDVSGAISALSIKDTAFFIQYFGDTSRQFRFNVSAIPTSTTRILSIPDSGSNDTFVTQAATQTLTNKTLTAPVIASINTGSVTFALPSADGSNGQVLQTNGSAVLSFVPAATTVGNVAANDSNVTFTSSSNRVQICTPTAARTYTMPTTGISAGDTWTFYNEATSWANVITIQSSGSNTITVVPPQGFVTLYALVATPTTAANWLLKERQSDFVAYTPSSFGGFGTVTSITAAAKVVGKVVHISFIGQTGTVSAALGFVPIPSTLTLSTTAIASTATGSSSPVVGYFSTNGQANSNAVVCTATSTANVYFAAYIIPTNATSEIGSSVPFSGSWYAPII